VQHQHPSLHLCWLERGRCVRVYLSLSLCSACTIAMQFSCMRRKKGESDPPCVVSWSRTLEVVGSHSPHFFSEKGSARGSYIFYLAGGINVILFLTLPSTLPRVRCCAPPPRVCGRAVSARLPAPHVPYIALLFLEIQVTEQKK
jgi:hypothetical protein